MNYCVCLSLPLFAHIISSASKERQKSQVVTHNFTATSRGIETKCALITRISLSPVRLSLAHSLHPSHSPTKLVSHNQIRRTPLAEWRAFSVRVRLFELVIFLFRKPHGERVVMHVGVVQLVGKLRPCDKESVMHVVKNSAYL